MKSLTNKEKINNKQIKKETMKNNFIGNTEDYNKYLILYEDSYLYNNEDNYPKYNDYQKKYTTKKNKFSNIPLDEVKLVNMYNKINESFCDKKNDRDSLTLQIAGTESLNEIKYKKRHKKYDNFKSSPSRMKTPEKKIKDIKKKAKARKYRQKKEVKNNNTNINNNIIERNYGYELNNYNDNNTATFNEENANKKYNEFTFHKEENMNNNNFNDNLDNNNNEIINNINDEYRNGGKINLYENNQNYNNYSNNKHISIDADNRKKILQLLKLKKVNINKNKNTFVKISKSQDQLKLPKKEISKTEKKYYHNDNFEKTFNNFGSKGKLDKRLLKEIIYDKGSPRIKKNIKKRNIIDYEENSPRLINHSFDAPRTYQKKIIKRLSNDIIKKKKSDFKNHRVKTEDKLISPLSNYNNRNNYINYSNTKTNENSILHQSIGLNYISSNSSLTPMNKKWIYSSGNKNIISNYYNNNFYNTPIKNYVEQSSFFIEYNKKSRSLNNSIKKIFDKSRKIRNYNHLNKRDNCINISLNNSSANLNDDSFYFNTNNSIFPKYEIMPIISYEYRTPKINLNKSKFNNHISINFEELMIIGEKLFDIIKSLINNKKMANQCFEFWNYFFNSALQKDINIIILKSELKDAIFSVNYSLMSILICYDYSFDIILIEKCFSLFKEILELIINNYFIFCKYIMKKVSKKNRENKWIYKLNNMLSKNKNYSNINNINNNYIMNNTSSVEKIIYNTNIITKNLKIILEHFKSNSNESLLMLFKKITKKNYEDINYYYRNFLLREENINGSFLASLYLKDNPNFHTVPQPYIIKRNNKKYTLVLDLEETLLNFRLKSENKGEGILKMRPGLFEFLDEMQKYYEIILFTASSQDYAESLIESIEEKKKYFDYTFFRQHNIIIENDFVKDLSRIGRDLDKMIIVDNMPQNYRLNKKNGIHIKGFWGEDLFDKILYNLKDILVNIAKDGGDLRDGLIKYHEDIADKITSNIYKFNFE